MSIDSPLSLYQSAIPADWIDYNGHMNVAYYVLAFDYSTDALMDYLGLDSDYRERTQNSAFVLEGHITYDQELVQDDPIHCTTQLLDYDAKRIHYFQQMYHSEKGFLAATNELILLHMDMSQRRSAPMPTSTLEQLEAVMAAHKQLPKPPQVGRVIGIRRREQNSVLSTS